MQQDYKVMSQKEMDLQFLTGDTVSFYRYIYNEHISWQEHLLASFWLIDLFVTEIVRYLKPVF